MIQCARILKMISASLRSKIFIAALIPVAFFFLYLVYYGFRSEGIDDFFMAATLSGAYGLKYRVYMLFVNVLYGYMLLPLYALFPSVSWYNVGEALCAIMALATFVFILLEKFGRRLGILVGIVFCAVFCKQLFLDFNFTLFAGILAAAGGLCIADGIPDKDKTNHLVWGGFLLFLASLIRYEAFLMSLPFTFVCIAYAFVFKNAREYVIRNVTCLLIIGAVIGGAKGFDSYMYNRNDDLRYYREYSGYRASIVDYRDFDYEQMYDAMEESGFKSVDARALNLWQFYDADVFPLEKLKRMSLIIRESFPPIRERVKRMVVNERFSTAFRLPIFWACILGSVIAYRQNKKIIGVLCPSLLLALSLSSYFVDIGRIVPRLEFCVWINVAAILIACIECREYVFFTCKRIFAVLIVLSCFLPLYIDFTQEGEPLLVYAELNDYMRAHKQKIFLLSFAKYKYVGTAMASKGLFRAVPPGELRNQIPLGYWNVNFPGIKEALAARHIMNPMTAVVRSDAYVVGKLNDEFLRAHHFPDLAVSKTNILCGDSAFIFQYRETAEKPTGKKSSVFQARFCFYSFAGCVFLPFRILLWK